MGRDEDTRAHDEVIYLAAGVADLVMGGMRGAVRRLPGLGEVRQELRARGELALRRTAQTPPAHMEVLARRVGERNAQAGQTGQVGPGVDE
ncbi:hypothetical protein SAMN04489712_1226 [Thermomonospora echinospora]|uniref:Polyprenyl synthetase n=1 Tax=Thermomonospora echinospora TaxID=1992 RepID=A0A1H6DV46_9ACTN|nr:polyprenyl synthetase [Thermomonospora echinospora]SEG88455.1 hypothetical protein SAMN04489712_1226 [Thermomonospora echinospora]